MKINNVAIFGGNGAVGSLTAAIVAGFGEAKVYLVCRDKSKTIGIEEKLYKSIKSDIIKPNIIIVDYDEAKNILCKCDWIFESVREDYDVKNKVLQFISQYSNAKSFVTTGTSGLSINKLSNNFSGDRRKYFFGTHFFNPPYNMTLCEIIMSKYSDKKLVSEFSEYLKKTLLRKIIYSKDKAAFIANRIGFKVLNDALLLSDMYSSYGGIDYIDYLLSGYTGRSMKPLETINFVGLDIHKAIVNNIYTESESSFEKKMILPSFYNELIEKGDLGMKTGRGLYSGKNMVYDIKSKKYRNVKEYKNDVIDKINKDICEGKYEDAYYKLFNSHKKNMEIVKTVLVEYIVYSIIISNETADDISACDDAMVNGFGWCPPLALKDLIDKIYDFDKLIKKYITKDIISKYDLYKLMKDVPKSKYHYGRYIKSI